MIFAPLRILAADVPSLRRPAGIGASQIEETAAPPGIETGSRGTGVRAKPGGAKRAARSFCLFRSVHPALRSAVLAFSASRLRTSTV